MTAKGTGWALACGEDLQVHTVHATRRGALARWLNWERIVDADELAVATDTAVEEMYNRHRGPNGFGMPKRLVRVQIMEAEDEGKAA